MVFGFCLFKYFPFGGLQRDFLRIALECQKRGHRIRVYVSTWESEQPDGFDIIYVPQKGINSPARNRAYVSFVQKHLKSHPLDYLVGFNKIPGLDCYYAADGCFLAKTKQQRGVIYRLSSRFRHFVNNESAIFKKGQQTEILMISKLQIPIYQKFYQTESERFHLLPPGVSRDRIAPDNAAQERQSFRCEFGIEQDEWLWLMVGSGFKTKGVDRSLRALHSLPAQLRKKTKIFIVGQDNPNPFKRLAAKLNITENICFFSCRDDIPKFLLGADILVHPAYHENTGTILLEALVAGLPVITTDICGYAHYINQAKAGTLLSHPFSQSEMNQEVLRMMNRTRQNELHQNALNYARDADLYSMPQAAADIIETLCQNKNLTSVSV